MLLRIVKTMVIQSASDRLIRFDSKALLIIFVARIFNHVVLITFARVVSFVLQSLDLLVLPVNRPRFHG